MKEEIITLGLDPRIGFSVVKYNFKDKKYHILYFTTLNKDKFPTKELRVDAKQFGTSLVYLDLSEKHLHDLIETYKPNYVATEDAFYQESFASSFRVLSSWITGISLMLYRKYRMSLYALSPKTVKKIIIGNAKAKKDETKILMKNAIINDSNIVWYDENYKDNLTEHSVDAIGVAIAHIVQSIENRSI